MHMPCTGHEKWINSCKSHKIWEYVHKLLYMPCTGHVKWVISWNWHQIDKKAMLCIQSNLHVMYRPCNIFVTCKLHGILVYMFIHFILATLYLYNVFGSSKNNEWLKLNKSSGQNSSRITLLVLIPTLM